MKIIFVALIEQEALPFELPENQEVVQILRQGLSDYDKEELIEMVLEAMSQEELDYAKGTAHPGEGFDGLYCQCNRCLEAIAAMEEAIKKKMEQPVTPSPKPDGACGCVFCVLERESPSKSEPLSMSGWIRTLFGDFRYGDTP